MQREEIAFVGTSDLSGHFRGKSFPTADLAARLQRVWAWLHQHLFVGARSHSVHGIPALKGKCFSFPIRPPGSWFPHGSASGTLHRRHQNPG